MFHALTAVLCGLLVVPTIASAATAPIRVLLLDGQSAGSFHNWKMTTPILRRELEETGPFCGHGSNRATIR